jgi:hypothetical protein
MSFGSRRKGARAELDLAKKFEAWWQAVEPGCVFRRTPGSGGWSHGDARGEFQTGGDLVTTAKRFPWSVEAKARESWAWKNVLAGKPSPVWAWWAQSCRAAFEANREPILVFRHNREPWWCMFSEGCPGIAYLDAQIIRQRVVAVARLDSLLTAPPLLFAIPADSE